MSTELNETGVVELEALTNEAVTEGTPSAEQVDHQGDGDIKISKPNTMPVADEEKVIGSSGTTKKGGKKASGALTVKGGVVGSSAAEAKPKTEKKPATKERDKVAIFSTRSVRWPNVGNVVKGYNIVSLAASEKWLARDHVREATPEEVAREYGQ